MESTSKKRTKDLEEGATAKEEREGREGNEYAQNVPKSMIHGVCKTEKSPKAT